MVLDIEPRSVSFVSLYEAEVHSEHHKGTSSPTHGWTKDDHYFKVIIFFYLETEERLQRVKINVVSGWFSMNN